MLTHLITFPLPLSFSLASHLEVCGPQKTGQKHQSFENVCNIKLGRRG